MEKSSFWFFGEIIYKIWSTISFR